MKIKGILFDAGGVYLKGEFTDFVNKAYKVLKIKGRFKASQDVFFDPELNKGNVTIETCFRRFFNVPISKSQMKRLISIWNETWKTDRFMVNLVKSLKKKYLVAIFSNSDKNNYENVYKKRGWYKYFDSLILSHELGVMKPDRKIYKIALKRLGLKPEECLFIDDQKECLLTARNIGMKTLLFESNYKLKRDLKRMKLI